MKPLTKYVSCTVIVVTVAVAGTFAQTGKKSSIPPKKATSPTVPVAELEAGKALIQKSDCMACHKTDVKLVGPAFIEVAKKYPAKDSNYDLIASKIIKGGSGVWGQIPMSPHASLSQPDAKKMAKYILSLK